MLINFADQTNVVNHYTSPPRSSNNNKFYQYNISPGQEIFALYVCRVCLRDEFVDHARLRGTTDSSNL